MQNRTCTICGKQFSSISSLNFHINSIHEAKTYDCQFCHKIFSTSLTLYVHKKRFHNATTKIVFKCDLCDKKYAQKSNLVDHVEKSHNRKKPEIILKCHICGKISPDKYKLRAHIENVHEKNDQIKCELCAEEFRCNDYLISHMREVHKFQKFDFRCEYCGDEFNQSSTLRTHTKQKHKNDLVEKFEKEIIKVDDFIQRHVCTRAVIREPDFKNRIDLFSIKRKWLCKCDFCGKPFMSNGILKTFSK